MAARKSAASKTEAEEAEEPVEAVPSGPGGSADEGTVVLGLQDPSRDAPLRQQVQQEELAHNHPVAEPAVEDR